MLSCSKRITDLHTVQSSTRLDTELDSAKLVQLKKSDNNLILSFSNGRLRYRAEITPGQDPIKFSPTGGFEGKASNINIYGDDEQSTAALTSKLAQSDSTDQTKVKEKTGANNIEKSKEKHIEAKRPAWQSAIMIVVMFAIIIGAGYLFLRYKSRPTININAKN